jgi:hypothetical protein
MDGEKSKSPNRNHVRRNIMFQQVKIQRMGEMAFHSPQMGPSMSPAFAFAAGTTTVAPAPVNQSPVIAPIPTPVAVAPAPVMVTQDWVGPTIVLAAVGLLIGLTA